MSAPLTDDELAALAREIEAPLYGRVRSVEFRAIARTLLGEVRRLRANGTRCLTAFLGMPGPALLSDVPFPALTPGATTAALCPACGAPFAADETPALVLLGPGADTVAQERAATGLSFFAVVVAVHWKCATGSKQPQPNG